MRTKICPSCNTPIQVEKLPNHSKGCKGPSGSKPIQIAAKPAAVKAKLGLA